MNKHEPQRVILGIDEATAKLRGATVTQVEFVQGETEDDDYLVLDFGRVRLYANAPTVYDDARNHRT